MLALEARSPVRLSHGPKSLVDCRKISFCFNARVRFRLALGFMHITGWFGVVVHRDRILDSRSWGGTGIRTEWRESRQGHGQFPSVLCIL